MLQKMRDQAQSLVAKILVGAIIFVMCVFGFGAFSLFAVGERAVATVDGEKIPESELLTQVERERRQMMAQMGAEFDPSQIDENQLRQRVLQRLITRTLLLQEADRESLAASPDFIDQTIRSIPQFRAGDQYSPELAKSVLAQMMYTPTSFRRELNEDIRLRQLSDGVARTGFITKAELSQLAALQRQKRDIAWLIIPAKRYADKVTISDDDIAAYYQDNLERYVEPERVEVDYLELDLAKFVADAQVTEPELQAEYAAEKRARGGEEERRVAHILLEVTKERDQAATLQLAQELRERAVAGEDFAQLAREYSEDPGSAAGGGDLGYISQESEFDPDFTKAAFALQPGTISEPVVTTFGVHLIKVSDVRTRKLPTLAELRETLETRVRKRKAEEAFAEARHKMEELAFEQFDSLEGVASELGLDIRHVGPFSRDKGQGIASDAKVRAAAFSADVLEKGNNSTPINLADERAVVLRVVEHSPSRQIPLEEVAEQVRSTLEAKRAAALAEDAGNAAIASLEQGLASDLVAASLGQSWTVVGDATRFHGAVPPAVLSAAFDLPRPDQNRKTVGSTALPNGDFAVITVSKVEDGSLEQLSEQEADALSRFLESESARTEFEAFRQSLEKGAVIERS